MNFEFGEGVIGCLLIFMIVPMNCKKRLEIVSNMQMQLQQKQMMGQEIPEDEIAQAQILVSDAQKNEKISKLMEAEQRMSMIVNELNQIILKPLEELYGSINQ